MQETMPNPTLEEAAILMRVTDHLRISKAELGLAINIFVARVQSLEDSKDVYSLLDICDGLLDSADEACETSRSSGSRTAFVAARIKEDKSEDQNKKLR
eukprot:3700980-Karenia_brevis.AAC.1